MFSKKRIARMLDKPFLRYGLPMSAAVLFGTLVFTEVVRINQLIPNRPHGLKEEELKDTFDAEKELAVRKGPILRSPFHSVPPLVFRSHYRF